MNVQPGDMAIVVGCPESAFNGATCEVLGPPAHVVWGELAHDGGYWLVRFGRSMPWLSWAGDMALHGREGAFPDQFLRRISGPELAHVERETVMTEAQL